MKPRSYASSKKVWINSKYIKTKWNQKLKAKFFRLFYMLHLVGNQAYKLELPKKWKIHNIFYVSLLEQDTTRKRRLDEPTAKLEFDDSKDKGNKYEIKAIWDSVVDVRESETRDQLPDLYYLIS